MSKDHDRLTELYAEAIDLEPAARRSLLDGLRRSEPTLAGELAALLDVGGKLAMPAETTVPIPGFRLLDRLGEGGMGVVYAAEQLEPARPVAIKVLYAASAEARSRFAAEAAIMKTLDHPGIACIHGSGDANGRPYIVMEQIVGLTLDEHVRVHTPSLRQRLELIAATLDAVHHAHTKGVIHRDLKPANIMVRSDGTVAVLDFGVARAVVLAGATRPGDYLGTPLYMSPEQAMARADEVDARADLYSVGVSLFELVAHKPPFELVGLSLMASVRKILDEPPPPLGHDPILDAIVARALAKAPAERYPTAAAFAAELRGYLGRVE